MPFDKAAKEAIRTCKDDLCDSILIPDEGAVILTYLESAGFLNGNEVEHVMSAGDGENSRPRVSRLLTILNAKMTTDLFRQLVELYRDHERGNNPIVADMLEESYNSSGAKKPVQESSAAKDIIRGMKNMRVSEKGDTTPVEAVSGTQIRLTGVKMKGPTAIGTQGPVTQVVGGTELFETRHPKPRENSKGSGSINITVDGIEADGPLAIGNMGEVNQFVRHGPYETHKDDKQGSSKK